METPDSWTKCLMHYDAKNKIVYINAKKSAFVGEVNKKELKNSIGKFKNFLLEITEEIAINK